MRDLVGTLFWAVVFVVIFVLLDPFLRSDFFSSEGESPKAPVARPSPFLSASFFFFLALSGIGAAWVLLVAFVGPRSARGRRILGATVGAALAALAAPMATEALCKIGVGLFCAG